MREDWIEVELGKILKVNNGYAFKSKLYKDTGIPVIRISDINNGLINLDRTVKVEEHLSYENYNVEHNDILIAMSGATTGKFGIYKLKTKAYLNQRVGNLKIYSEKTLLNKYLYFLLFLLKNEIIKKSYGGAQPNISAKNIQEFRVPLAPLPEQRAIVNKIETLFSELDSGIDSLIKAKEQLEIYKQAVLKMAFEGKLTKEWREKNNYSMEDLLNNIFQSKIEAINNKKIQNTNYFPKFKDKDLIFEVPANWIILPWKSIVANDRYAMKRGPFGGSLKKEFFVDKGIPVYEQSNAINNTPYKHRYFITEKKFEELKAFEVAGGDMIISCSGTLGRISLLPTDAKKGVINQALLKINLNEEIMLKKYFILLFRSETFQRLILKKSLGSAMPNMVGMNELKEIPIPIPSIKEQEKISRKD